MPAELATAAEGLLSWATSVLGEDGVGGQLSVVAGDASNRRYFRLRRQQHSVILVEAPPTTEKNEAFLAVRQRLAEAGIRVPDLLAADLERGYLILEDLGDRLLLRELTPENAERQYRQALDVLRQFAAIDLTEPGWPRYDRALLTEELGRFPAWFVDQLLGIELDSGEQALLRGFGELLIASALAQPRVLVHRDFHSRNLMPQADGRLGVIDFQDAVIGPVTYDAVSLLRDCYIRWPAGQVRGWALEFRRQLLAAGQPAGASEAEFLQWFDWMGLQRHIKVLGTFARLYLRDGKAGYLADLPPVLAYVREVVAGYVAAEPQFAEFARWFEARLEPAIARQPWSRPA